MQPHSNKPKKFHLIQYIGCFVQMYKEVQNIWKPFSTKYKH